MTDLKEQVAYALLGDQDVTIEILEKQAQSAMSVIADWLEDRTRRISPQHCARLLRLEYD